MIIEVRCFTCSKVLADKWNYYCKRVKELESEQAKKTSQQEGGEKEINPLHFDKTIRQKVFEELELDRICCRRMLLSHVDLIETI
jgi:DNA-directed RNA polymerase subunit N (RpoN/RPB10)